MGRRHRSIKKWSIRNIWGAVCISALASLFYLGRAEAAVTPAEPEQIEGIYQIGTAEELYWFAGLVNGSLEGVDADLAADAVLTADIAVNTVQITAGMDTSAIETWTPMGTGDRGYSGTFDGGGYTVSGLYNSNNGWSGTGLFGGVSGGTVKDLTLANSYFRADNYIGGVAGIVKGGTMENLTVLAGVSIEGNYNIGGIAGRLDGGGDRIIGCTSAAALQGGDSVGGIIGSFYSGNQGGLVESSRNTGSVTGKSAIGGILGYGNKNLLVKGCVNDGEIRSTDGEAGGISGYDATIEGCINRGAVTAGGNNRSAGGIVGRYANVSRCGNEGTVTGAYAGGICGYNENGSITDCYNLSRVTGARYAGGIIGLVSSGSTIEGCFNAGAVTGPTEYIGAVAGNYLINEYPMGTNYYLEGTAAKGTGAGTDTAVSRTADQFASGEVAWRLSLGVTDGTQAWYQNLDNGGVPDPYPVLNILGKESKTVYLGAGCSDYTNTVNTGGGAHSFGEDGFCTGCGQYEEAGYDAETGVYQIANAGQLYWFAALVNGDSRNAQITEKKQDANGALMADIVVNDGVMGPETDAAGVRMWYPIGISDSYQGRFDGGGYKISGLYCTRDKTGTGLFGVVKGNGHVKNVTVKDSYFKGAWSTGAVVGHVPSLNEGGNSDDKEPFTGCKNENTYVEGYDYVGGVFGEFESNIRVSGCSNTGTVRGSAYVGGVGGYVKRISDSWNSGSVTGTKVVGGVGGSIWDEVRNSYNTGNIMGKDNGTGGIAGQVNRSGGAEGCFNTGTVGAEPGTSTHIGAICGESSHVKACYYLEGTAEAGVGYWGSSKEIETSAYPRAAFLDGTVRSYLQNYLYYDYSGGRELTNWKQGTEHPEFTRGSLTVSVSITWDDMSYTYYEKSGGTWDTDSHTYVGRTDGGWVSDGGTVTVENNGETDVKARFAYTASAGYEEIDGSFAGSGFHGSGAADEKTGIQIQAPVSGYQIQNQGKVKLELSGRPPTAFPGGTEIGTVTVTIGGR